MRKKAAYYSLSLVMALQTMTPLVRAEEASQGLPQGVSAIGGIGGGTTTQLTPGTYSSIKYEEVMIALIQSRNDLQQRDFEYLKSIGGRIAASINDLIILKKKFDEMAQKTQTRYEVTLDAYLSLINDINATISRIKLEIQESQMISAVTLPSHGMKVGDQTLDMGVGGSTINLTPALKGFVDELDVLVNSISTQKISKLRIVRMDAAGKIISDTPLDDAIKGSNPLNPDLSKIPPMTAEEIEAALLKIEELSIVSQKTQEKQQILADLTVAGIKKFIEEVGVKQFLNPRNDNDYIAAQKSFKQIEMIFFLRSYLRKKYGLMLGAITPAEYPPSSALNFSDWTSPEALTPVKTALSSIRSQTSKTDIDIIAAYQNARKFVELYDRHITPILSADSTAKRAKAGADWSSTSGLNLANISTKTKAGLDWLTAGIASHEEIMSQKPAGAEYMNADQKSEAYNSDDTGFMTRMSSFFIKATGQAATVEALLGVYRLILMDIREELMLSQGDLPAMQNLFDKRYFGTKEMAVKSTMIICNNDKTLTDDYKTKRTESLRDYFNNPETKETAEALGLKATSTCGAPSNGILGNQRNSGGQVTTVFGQLIDKYIAVEIKRAQDARNLRQVIQVALQAQAQEGDQIEDNDPGI